MRRSSPVQQWLDSLPTDAQAENTETSEEKEHTTEPKSDESKTEQSVTENTIIQPTDKTIIEAIEETLHEENILDIPSPKELLKRKSLESGVLSTRPQCGTIKNKLQRDLSVQSEGPAKVKNPLLRDHSLQSDASGSSGSSVLNVLGARKVDAESVLLALGFGPSEKQQKLQRIPDRFLVPSKLKGISTEQFIKDEHHSMRMHDCGVFGYRGLTGNPHVPPSTIVAKIMECILHDDVAREQALAKARHSIADMRSAPTARALVSRLRHS